MASQYSMWEYDRREMRVYQSISGEYASKVLAYESLLKKINTEIYFTTWRLVELLEIVSSQSEGIEEIDDRNSEFKRSDNGYYAVWICRYGKCFNAEAFIEYRGEPPEPIFRNHREIFHAASVFPNEYEARKCNIEHSQHEIRLAECRLDKLHLEQNFVKEEIERITG